jgi:bifunctional non-homologous end joining protein LigD
MPRWSISRVIAAPGFIEPCLPTVATRPPNGPLWLHEIKHDGYRLMVKKHGDAVRIYTRRGADWTDRFPAIVGVARKIKAFSFHIDGEGVVCSDAGLAMFDRLHSKSYDAAVFLFAFDLIEVDGTDLRKLALVERKLRLRALLARRKSGIVYNDHIDGDGATIYAHACKLGFEGIVSKRRDFGYSSGRSKGWLKVKNPKAPAALRIEEGTF